jgi:hypothetical protein
MRAVVARLGAWVAAAGLAVLIAGTFLPWLRSGVVLRDSYQSVGALRALVSGGVADTLLNAWLLVIPVCGLSVALYALRLRRVSAALVCLVSAVVGTAAALVVVQRADPGALIAASATGPAVTLAGATAALVGAIAVVAGPHGRQAETTGGSP